MNQNLQKINELLQQAANLSAVEKGALQQALADADEQWAITDFKLERTEKVKRTTAILLEETILELEQKRKAVEAQNREREIEVALERVRARSLAMLHTNELKEVVSVVFEKLQELGFVLNNGGAVILIFSENSKDVVHWVASPDLLSSSIHLTFPYFDHPINIDLFNAKARGRDYYAKLYSYEEKK